MHHTDYNAHAALKASRTHNASAIAKAAQREAARAAKARRTCSPLTCAFILCAIAYAGLCVFGGAL